VQEVVNSKVIPAMSGNGFASVNCPAGMISTGGGFSIQNPASNSTGWEVIYSGNFGTGWQVGLDNESPQDITLAVFAECFKLS
jgi:hypothetical protein